MCAGGGRVQGTSRSNRYSVPVRLISRNVRAMLHASELVVYDGRDEVARHGRLIAKGGTRLELDHYLEALVRTPGALPGATALDQARSGGRFTPVHDAWWEAAVKAHGERDGTRALIEVLLLGRHLPHEHLVTGLAAALRTGALTADAVLLGTLVLSTVKVVPGEHLSVSFTTGTSSPRGKSATTTSRTTATNLQSPSS
ncbi:Mu transposase domain-containing protein [[Kitasatospora] papulosa]|uniref:Mu transposase domain-containing protein n=2 Tax=Streptomyces TaxID=1883 RepID=UPI003812CC1A